MIVAIAGSVLFTSSEIYIYLLGVLLINFWLVLDCVDGNIARCKKTSSIYGEFIDALSGYTILSFVYLSIGIHAFNNGGLFIHQGDIRFVIMGALASIFDILARIIHQKYQFTMSVDTNYSNEMLLSEKEVDKRSFSYIRNRIDKELGISGFFMPLLIASTIFDSTDVLILFYFFFNLVAVSLVLVTYIRKANHKIKE